MSRRGTNQPFDASTPIDDETRLTERRLERLRSVAERRQEGLHVLLENVHDPHNVSAVLRTCDAVGVDTVHLLYTVEPFPRFGKKSSAGVAKWARVFRYESVSDAVAALRHENLRIAVTMLDDRAVSLYDVVLTEPTVLCFGNEHRGISEELRNVADLSVKIPMVGFVESLNISVACAVTLFEAMRQRIVGGLYDPDSIDLEEVERRVQRWAKL